MPRYLASVCAVVLIATLSAGCSAPSAPVSSNDSASPGVDMALFGPWNQPPTGSGLSGFYPIEIGNSWRYERNIAVSIRSGDDVSTEYLNGSVQHTQLCFEDRGGRRYVLQQHLDGTGFELAVSYLRLREDRGGLYEADVPSNEPGCPGPTVEPASAEGGSPNALLLRAIEREADPARRAAFERAGRAIAERVAAARFAATGFGMEGFGGRRAGEILRLRYPLHVGQRWIVRASPRFTSRAEAIETVVTGAGPLRAWRIRTDSEFFGPDDRVYAWYGEAGFVQMGLHIESEATDAQGNPVGRVYWDELLRLEELHLAGD